MREYLAANFYVNQDACRQQKMRKRYLWVEQTICEKVKICSIKCDDIYHEINQGKKVWAVAQNWIDVQ